MPIQTRHYIDFHGDLRQTICGLEPLPDFGDCTVYLSAATCPRCLEAIQARLGGMQQAVATHLAAASA